MTNHQRRNLDEHYLKFHLASSTTGQITETTESETVSSNAVEYVDNEDQADQQLDHSLLLSAT